MFHVKIEQDEDGVFIATVPALRGCVSDGITEAEAIEHVKDAIDGWLEAQDRQAVRELPADEQHELIDLNLPAFAAPQIIQQQLECG